MALSLRDDSSMPSAFTGGFHVDNMSWWFWMKAGMGFTLGAGLVYVLFGMLWIYLITQAPALMFIRAFTRF